MEDFILDKIAKLELDIRYLQEAAQGEHIKVGFKLLDPAATIPTKAHPEDAAWDLYALEDTYLVNGVAKIIRTGVAFELPQYYHGMVWDRSSMGAKGIKVMGGLIDQPYTGEIKVVLVKSLEDTSARFSFPSYEIKAGDKIAQIVFTKLPITYLIQKEELGETSRGEKGFGSSGR